MQRVDEVSEPLIVGHRYLVPTVRYPWCGIDGDWPVLGPRHEDAEHIGFPYWHYHVDGRFLTKREAAQVEGHTYRHIETEVSAAPLCNRDVVAHPPIVYRARRCSRVRMPHLFESSGKLLWPSFRAAYADKALIAGPHGWICPHRGAHLGNQTPNAEGYIVCPLHGLRFNVENGKPAPWWDAPCRVAETPLPAGLELAKP